MTLKNLASFVTAVFCSAVAYAQAPNVLLEACNSIKNATKRQECLKAANAQKPPEAKPIEQIVSKPVEPPPFSVEVAATACEVLMTSMATRRMEAIEDTAESTSEVMFITWPPIDNKPQAYCGVDRQSRKMVSLGKGEKAITGAKLTRLIAETEAFNKLRKEIAEGNYANFVATAKNALTQDFKDPSSAQYKSLFISGDGMPVLCGEVNAKNSYGAYVGFRRFYATGKQFLNAVETPSERFVFERMWPSMCGSKKADIER